MKRDKYEEEKVADQPAPNQSFNYSLFDGQSNSADEEQSNLLNRRSGRGKEIEMQTILDPSSTQNEKEPASQTDDSQAPAMFTIQQVQQMLVQQEQRLQLKNREGPLQTTADGPLTFSPSVSERSGRMGKAQEME